jgi:predicted DNA-binding transcriptional regulator AlpA
MTMTEQAPAEESTEPLAFTIAEFCKAYRISRTAYFRLRAGGKAPREIHVGRRVVISREAVADWRTAREAADA